MNFKRITKNIQAFVPIKPMQPIEKMKYPATGDPNF